MRRALRHNRRALTLLEVLVSIGLIGMLLGALVTFFGQILRVRREVTAVADRNQIARQVLEGIAAELRGCVGMEEIGFPVEQRLIGDRRTLSFLTTALPPKELYDFFGGFDDDPPGQHDLRLLTYSLWIDPEETDDDGEPIVGGIIRTLKRTLNQLVVDEDDPLDVRNDLWSHELGYLEFRYFDGVEWDVKWDVTQGNSLPQLVQVTVGFESITDDELNDGDLDEFSIEEYPLGVPIEHADRASIIVRIPAADRFFGSRFQRVGQQLADQFDVEGGG